MPINMGTHCMQTHSTAILAHYLYVHNEVLSEPPGVQFPGGVQLPGQLA